jgi:hypothetical protein
MTKLPPRYSSCMQWWRDRHFGHNRQMVGARGCASRRKCPTSAGSPTSHTSASPRKRNRHREPIRRPLAPGRREPRHVAECSAEGSGLRLVMAVRGVPPSAKRSGAVWQQRKASHSRTSSIERSILSSRRSTSRASTRRLDRVAHRWTFSIARAPGSARAPSARAWPRPPRTR